MGIEQIDNTEREAKKKDRLEQERREQFFLEKHIRAESSALLQKLALQISQEFGMDISQAKELIRGNTRTLEKTLQSSDSPEQLKNNLSKAILEAQKNIESLSKKYRKDLRESIIGIREQDEDYEIYHGYITDTFFSRAKQQALFPKNLKDQCIGVGLGILDSTEAVILFLYGLGKGVLLTPYHLYLIITGKANYDGWKKI